MTTPVNAEQSHWIETAKGYALTIADGAVTVRNAKGKVLKSVPAAVKKTDEYLELENLLFWLNAHDAECGAQVERWLLRSLPVPSTVVAAVWPDEAWQSWLRDLIISPVGDDSLTGFLRSAHTVDGEPELGIVDLDGETRTITAEEITIPHPAIIGELNDFREFAADLEITQRFDQLHRAVHTRPDPLPDPAVMYVNTWADGHFEQLRFAVGRAQSAGYAVQGGQAVTHIYEDGQLVEAAYHIGIDEYPESPTMTGELWWSVDGATLPVREVGPVAYSEGVRMATHIYAGRTVEEDE